MFVKEVLHEDLLPVPLAEVEEVFPTYKEVISTLDFERSTFSNDSENSLIRRDSRIQDFFLTGLREEKINELKFYDLNSISILNGTNSPLDFLRMIQSSGLGYANIRLKGIDSYFESSVQLAALQIISQHNPDGIFVQVGGNGTHALKHLLLGRGQSILVTPSLGEAIVATIESFHLNVNNRFFCILGFGESLPLKDESVDIVYYGGSLHHTNYKVALSEAIRVTKKNGIFLALEAIETFGYKSATKILQKREPEVACIILNKEDLSKIKVSHPHSEFIFGGFLLRYFFIGLQKLGIVLPSSFVVKSQILVDRLAGSYLRKFLGSAVLINIIKN